MTITFDIESEAQALAAELNADAGRDVRYQVERYGEKWSIARQSRRTYWGWDEFLTHRPKPAVQKNDVQTVRQIVELAFSDGLEIAILMALVRSQNEGGVNAKLAAAGAGEAGVFVRNSLFAWLIVKITRELAKNTREGDLHLARAFELLEGDTLAILQDIGSAEDMNAAKKQWGPTATWLWTELKQLGLPVICIDARHAKAVLKMQINKSDRNDAAGIGRIMQTGWFKEVRVKDLDSHSVRALLASRALLVKIKRDLENQVRGLLKNLGLVIGRAKFNTFAKRAEERREELVGRSHLRCYSDHLRSAARPIALLNIILLGTLASNAPPSPS